MHNIKASYDYQFYRHEIRRILIVSLLILIVSLIFVIVPAILKNPEFMDVALYTFLGAFILVFIISGLSLLKIALKIKKLLAIDDLIYQDVKLERIQDDYFSFRREIYFHIPLIINGETVDKLTAPIFFTRSLNYPTYTDFVGKEVTVGYSLKNDRIVIFEKED